MEMYSAAFAAVFLAHFGAYNSAHSGRDLLIIAPIVFGTDCALLETYDDQIRRAYWRWAVYKM